MSLLLYREHISRYMLQRETEKLFVFGDNMVRRGMGGQAASMRGEPNAVGIPTKKLPSMGPNAFLDNDDFHDWLEVAVEDFYRLLAHPGVIVWPHAGIGTGRALLRVKAPLIWAEIESWRRELELKI